MGTPKYFSNFKNIDYALKIDKAGNTTNIKIKDFFQLMRLRDDVFREDTLYTEYVVQDNETPDQVARKFYEDEQFYWVILQINGITDYYDQWPLSTYELEQYIIRKYGIEGSGVAHHYETVEVRDSQGHILQHAGHKVTEDYRFLYVDSNDPTVELTAIPSEITNRQYEFNLNAEKGRIQILDPEYILDFAREYENFALNQPGKASEVDISEAIQ